MKILIKDLIRLQGYNEYEGNVELQFDEYKPVQVEFYFQERHRGEARLHVYVGDRFERAIDLVPSDG